MKIASWNVNSFRKRKDTVLDWLEAQSEPVDVLGLQETKCTNQVFPEDDLNDLDYEVAFDGQPKNNGVALVSLEEASQLKRGFGDGLEKNPEKRLIAGRYGDIEVVNLYLPNGEGLDSAKYPYKLKWMARLLAFLERHYTPETPLVLIGDFNVVPAPIDAHPGLMVEGGMWASPKEREAYQSLLSFGLSDAFRLLHPDEPGYTWWDYRNGAFEKGHGMRIDHVLVTPPLLERLVSVEVDVSERQKENPSDHAPVVLTLSDLALRLRHQPIPRPIKKSGMLMNCEVDSGPTKPRSASPRKISVKLRKTG